MTDVFPITVVYSIFYFLASMVKICCFKQFKFSGVHYGPGGVKVYFIEKPLIIIIIIC